MIVNHHFTVEVGLNETTPPEVGCNAGQSSSDICPSHPSSDIIKKFKKIFSVPFFLLKQKETCFQ
jgi:hypothetical protein